MLQVGILTGVKLIGHVGLGLVYGILCFTVFACFYLYRVGLFCVFWIFYSVCFEFSCQYQLQVIA